ncbi:MAG: chromosome segregation protein SMC [Oscillospiraceae bacterium]|nr:chromosome segregation protein SMC [Oscillospiraceae bacterium]
MYLKALEIQGFKSFPDKTVLSFEKDITAIVGPNGSGKSNISDALLWVMGEQRTKALRGAKMEDVIFGGTEKRSPMGFAQVSLILDNSKGTFDLDTPELVIGRRYYRSGDSEYFLNRKECRLKDITGLLRDTGLGRDGYSVIGQGRIDEIVSAKSHERREVFEEAAGIAGFRADKEEAERRLKHTEENLLRINDKIEELELQVGPLQKQAEAAKKYLVARDELRGLEISLWTTALDDLAVKIEAADGDYKDAIGRLNIAQRELEDIYAISESLSEKMRACDIEAEAEREKLRELDGLIAARESDRAVLRANLENNVKTLERLKQDAEDKAKIAGELENKIAEGKKSIENADKAAEELFSRQDELGRKILEEAEAAAAADGALSPYIAEESRLLASISAHEAALNVMHSGLGEREQRLREISEEYEENERKLLETEKKLKDALIAEEELRSRMSALSNVINGHKMLTQGKENELTVLEKKRLDALSDKNALTARIKVLSDLEKEYEGMGKAVKNVMKAAERGLLRGIHGPLASLIETSGEYSLAIETALGGALSTIVVDEREDAEAAINYLKRSDGGRGTFDNLRSASQRAGRRVLKDAPVTAEGYVGIASELCSCDAKYECLIADKLGLTVVMDSLRNAVSLSRSSGDKYRIVTLDGQLINAGGSMTGGSSVRQAGTLSRSTELRELKEKLEVSDKRLLEAEDSLSSLRKSLQDAKRESERASIEREDLAEKLNAAGALSSSLRAVYSATEEALERAKTEKARISGLLKGSGEMEKTELDALTQDRNALPPLRKKIEELTCEKERHSDARTALGEELSETKARILALAAEKEALQRAKADNESTLKSLLEDDDRRKDDAGTIEAENKSIEEGIEKAGQEIKALSLDLDEKQKQISEINSRKLSLEGKRTEKDRAAQKKNSEIVDLNARAGAVEQRKNNLENEEKQITDKLWDNYELTRSGAMELRRELENPEAARKRAAELKREISRLGDVNIPAIKEYERVSERYEFLSSQRDDVKKSATELTKIISDITNEMENIFVKEFKAINEEFKRVFTELFGGGRAELTLEDEGKPLECGIEITVRPPGKALSTISLLSGGEKAFVAICLYYAIMRVRPTPFCIMDEIDAALDEENVRRFSEYMRNLSERTQFLVITHHRGTMENADTLYGVTMQEKGVTTVLSVDLDEAEKVLVTSS